MGNIYERHARGERGFPRRVMNENYRQRPKQRICRFEDIYWMNPERQKDEKTGLPSRCWPLANEAQMWEEARCHECGSPAQFVGIGTPFGDGIQYFLESEAWCLWCFPRENFTEDELVLVRHAEWGREETLYEILELLSNARPCTDAQTVDEFYKELVRDIKFMQRRENEPFPQVPAWRATL
jgi:hypothetical protein